MTDTQQRSVDDTARASNEFLETIRDTAERLGITPSLAVHLFGFLSRSIVAKMIDEGQEPGAAHATITTAFVHGLGLRTIAAEIRGEEAEQLAEQLRAEIESADGEAPLQ